MIGIRNVIRNGSFLIENKIGVYVLLLLLLLISKHTASIFHLGRTLLAFLPKLVSGKGDENHSCFMKDSLETELHIFKVSLRLFGGFSKG